MCRNLSSKVVPHFEAKTWRILSSKCAPILCKNVSPFRTENLPHFCCNFGSGFGPKWYPQLGPGVAGGALWGQLEASKTISFCVQNGVCFEVEMGTKIASKSSRKLIPKWLQKRAQN